MKPGMKLFVWEGVLTDYTSGMIVALAPDLETALSLMNPACREEAGRVEPEVTDMTGTPQVWYVNGGG